MEFKDQDPMTLLDRTLDVYKQSASVKIKQVIVCTHAKFSSLELCRVLQSADIEVTFYPVDYSKESSNIDTLLAMGVRVIEQEELLLPFISSADVVIEDGARITKIIQKFKPNLKESFFSVEQTSGGARYHKENPSSYPVIDVAMSPLKLDVENRRATPEGVIQHFSDSTGKTLGGKKVFILGFGSIGEGLARLARILGANVTVFDNSAVRRVFAKHRGYAVIEKDLLDSILPYQDVIFTATNTYQGNVLGIERILLMKNDAIICNAGSGRGELGSELQTLGSYKMHDAAVTITEDDDHLVLNLIKGEINKTITVLAKSYPINLHIGNGTSHDAIEVVMALMLLVALKGPDQHLKSLQALSNEVQEIVAQLSLNQDRLNTELKPRFVESKSISLSERPYGGVFPFHNDLSGVANLSIVRALFKAGSKTRGHYHRRSQEAYYAEKGSAEVIIWHKNEKLKSIYKLNPGDYLLVPEYYFHDVHVTSSDDFECLVIATPPFQLWDQFFDESHSLVD